MFVASFYYYNVRELNVNNNDAMHNIMKTAVSIILYGTKITNNVKCTL